MIKEESAPQQVNVVQVDFQKRGNLQRVEGYKGIYRYAGEPGFYIRPVVDGRQRVYKLKATTLARADTERGKLIAELAQYHAGLGRNPFARTDAITLRELGQFYLDKGCPRKNGSQPREGKLLKEERQRVFMLTAWPGARNAAETITAERWRDYKDWRLKHTVRAGKLVTLAGPRSSAAGGLRQVDKERITLSNVFRCAIRNHSATGIASNPVLGFAFEKFQDPGKVSHCRDHMPRSGDDLHAIARYFFNRDPRSEVLGWLVLLSARIGQRCHEMLHLRTDAASKDQPGFIGGSKLYLFRSTTNKGTYGHVEIDRDFKTCLDAHRAWLQARYPKSPWFFPSPVDPSKPIGENALSHAMGPVCQILGLHECWPHGLRAFRVNVLRSQGMSDAEVALRIGHKTGGKLIVEVYGEGLDYPLTWLPQHGEPAWHALKSSPAPKYVQTELF